VHFNLTYEELIQIVPAIHVIEQVSSTLTYEESRGRAGGMVNIA